MRARPVLIPAFALAAACGGPLDIRYETEHLRVGTAFDRPLCRGDLEDLESQLAFVSEVLESDMDEDVDVFLWESAEELDCPLSGALGCFDERRKEIRATPGSVDHELVHAVAAGIERRPDLAFHEGIAEALSMDRTVFGSTLPSDNLEKEDSSFVSYATVGHFSRWLLQRYGPQNFRALLNSRQRDPRDAFQDAYGSSIYEEQDRYLAEVPWVYPRFDPCPFEHVGEVSNGWMLQESVSCADDKDVRSSDEGLTVSRVFEVQQPDFYDLTSNHVAALARCTMVPIVVPVADAEKFAFHDPDHEGLPGFLEPIARQYQPGETHTVYLRPGLHLLEVRVEGWDDTTVGVTVFPSLGQRPATPPPYDLP